VITFGGGAGAPVSLWDTDGKAPPQPAADVKPLRALEGLTAAPHAVALSPDGKAAAVADRAGRVLLFDADSGRLRFTWQAQGGAASALAFSPDGKLLAGAHGSDEATVYVWETAGGKEQARFAAGNKAVTALAFAADDQWLASGSADGWVQVWGAASGTRQGGWKAHAAAVLALAFDPGGAALASAAADNAVQVWDVADGKPRWRAARRYRSRALTLAYSADGQSLAVGVEAGAQVVKVADGSVAAQAQLGPVYAAQFAPDGASVSLLTTRGTGSTFHGTLRLTESGAVGRPRLEVPLAP
jgi:WD40 repeat protein